MHFGTTTRTTAGTAAQYSSGFETHFKQQLSSPLASIKNEGQRKFENGQTVVAGGGSGTVTSTTLCFSPDNQMQRQHGNWNGKSLERTFTHQPEESISFNLQSTSITQQSQTKNRSSLAGGQYSVMSNATAKTTMNSHTATRDQVTQIKLLLNDLRIRDQQIEILNEQVYDTEQSKGELQVLVGQLQKRLKSSEDNGSAKVKGLQDKYDAAQVRLREVQEKNAEFLNRISEQNDLLGDSEQQLSNARALLMRYEHEKASLGSEVNSVKEVLKGIQCSAMSSREEIGTLLSENSALENQLVVEQESRSKVEGQFEKAKIKIEGFEKKIGKKDERIKELEDNLVKAEKKIADSVRLSAENSQLRVDLNAIKVRFEESTRIIEESRNVISKLQESKMLLEETAERNEKDQKIAKKNHVETKKTNEQMSAENALLKAQIEDLKKSAIQGSEDLEQINSCISQVLDSLGEVYRRTSRTIYQNQNNNDYQSNLPSSRSVSAHAFQNALINEVIHKQNPRGTSIGGSRRDSENSMGFEGGNKRNKKGPIVTPDRSSSFISQSPSSQFVSQFEKQSQGSRIVEVVKQKIQELATIVVDCSKEHTEATEAVLRGKQQEELLSMQLMEAHREKSLILSEAMHAKGKLEEYSNSIDRTVSQIKEAGERNIDGLVDMIAVTLLGIQVVNRMRKRESLRTIKQFKGFVDYYLQIKNAIQQNQQQKPRDDNSTMKTYWKMVVIRILFVIRLKRVQRSHLIEGDLANVANAVKIKEMGKVRGILKDIILGKNGNIQNGVDYIGAIIVGLKESPLLGGIQTLETVITPLSSPVYGEEAIIDRGKNDAMIVCRLREANQKFSEELQKMSHRVVSLGQHAQDIQIKMQQEELEWHKKYAMEIAERDMVIEALKATASAVGAVEETVSVNITERDDDQNHNYLMHQEKSNNSKSTANSNRQGSGMIVKRGGIGSHSMNREQNFGTGSDEMPSQIGGENSSYFLNKPNMVRNLETHSISMDSLQHELSSIMIKKNQRDNSLNTGHDTSSVASSTLPTPSRVPITKLPGRIIRNNSNGNGNN